MASMAKTRQGRGADVRAHGDMATCKACGHRFSTGVRGNTVRCPACKAANWIPKALTDEAEVIPLRAGPTLAVWAPPLAPVVEAEDADEDCPDCDTPLVWTPGGTLYYCETCEAPVFPAVLLPDDDQTDPRRVPTQAERDLAAIALAQRKGVMLVDLDRLADDDRLDPASLPIVEWFRDEVKSTTAAGRLDELAALLPDSDIRRRRWWQGRPALDAPVLDDEDDYDEDQGDEDEQDETPVALAIQVPAPRVDYDAELSLRGYRIDHDAPRGQCQIRARSTYSGDPNYYLCGGAARKPFDGAAICTNHYDALTTPLPGR